MKSTFIKDENKEEVSFGNYSIESKFSEDRSKFRTDNNTCIIVDVENFEEFPYNYYAEPINNNSSTSTQLSPEVELFNWVVTIINPKLTFKYLFELYCRYYVIGKFFSSKGTPYIQGFLSFSEKRTFTSVKSVLPCGHWATIRKGCAFYEIINYCKSSGNFISFGVPPTILSHGTTIVNNNKTIV